MAEEPKAAEVPEPSPEAKETSEVKADVVEAGAAWPAVQLLFHRNRRQATE